MISGNGNPAGGERHGELGRFLRAQRERLQPADVGINPYGDPARRRTPGLRREEVAELSGVGLTWYTWLEQGREVDASRQVIDALARTLRLDPDQHRHLRLLAGLAAPYEEYSAADRARLQWLVDSMLPSISAVYDPAFDFLVWNRAYALARRDPMHMPAERRNLLWMMFTDTVNRAMMPHWENAARAVIAQLREALGRRPEDPRLAALVAGLSEASPEFREWWSDYRVRGFRPAGIRIEHPVAGAIELEVFQLRPVEDPNLLLVTQIPATPEAQRRIAALLDGSETGQ
ncbi:helix-turn-helix transcriptional regulator [Nocardia yamanashiensis]|uniref:helix-turn-helix transcriptional regulator n=1 Tax=Nocardia yamanashiensis TaxID=209247 RepID=UPI001E59C625|nr:helix-turn-helix transcriptional regulator [Nocardia yamanashiensis]UGT42153.1 helix-turn-helix transcriptional regulator [Nocardia yamanashiensis]